MFFNIIKAWRIKSLYGIAMGNIPGKRGLQTFLLFLQGAFLNGGKAEKKNKKQ